MRVILIKGQSAYSALRIFIDDLEEAFAQRGYEPVVIDAADSLTFFDRVKTEAAKSQPALIFSFCILGEFRTDQGLSLAQLFQAPHVLQHVDYPLAHSNRLDLTAAETALLVIDQSHVNAITSVYGQDRFAHVAFSAHGAVGSSAVLEDDPDAFAAARPIPILFAGTFYKPPQDPWENMPSAVKKIFQNAVDITLAQEWMPALDALDIALRDKGLDPAAPEIAPIRKLATLVHQQVRTHRRFSLLKTAAKLGLPLHVYGSGYERDLYRFKNVTFGGEVDLARVLELMRQSRVVLNINANFGAGSHERPLTALMAGAVAATDHSQFYETHFEEGREIFLYRWQSLHADLAELGKLAEDPVAALEMVRAGQPRVVAEHRWSNRIDAILAAAEPARARLGIAA